MTNIQPSRLNYFSPNIVEAFKIILLIKMDTFDYVPNPFDLKNYTSMLVFIRTIYFKNPVIDGADFVLKHRLLAKKEDLFSHF